jgi:hypothetical protein
MKTLLTLILLVSCSISYATDITDFTSTSTNYFTELRILKSGRTAGMGGAFLAITDDSSVGYLNGAGFGKIKEKEVSFEGVGGGGVYAFFAQPVGKEEHKYGAYGFGWGQYGGYVYNNSYSESAGITKIGIPIGIHIYKSMYLTTEIGVLFKSREVTYSITPSSNNVYQNEDMISEKGSVANTFKNIAFMFSPSENINIGIIYQDKVNIPWKTIGPMYEGAGNSVIWPEIEGIDTLPSSIGVGMVLRVSDDLLIASDVIQKNWTDTFRIENGVDINPNFKDAIEFHIGAERIVTFKDKEFPVRFGLFTRPDFIDNGINEEQVFLTAGTEFRYKNFSFDIVIMDSNLLSSGEGSQTFFRGISVCYKFPIKDKEL